MMGARRQGPDGLRGLDPERHLRDPALKPRYVAILFELIASRYDRFTRWFSFGRDRRWKAELVEQTATRLPARGTVVDIACGTGDLALAVRRLVHDVRVIGIDASRGMLRRAGMRRHGPNAPAYVLGDMLALPVRGGSADAVTVGYGLRNVADAGKVISEIARVLTPGGSLLMLDFYQPEGRVWRAVFLWYLWVAGAVCGLIWHREPAAYAYIARSLRLFVTAPQMSRALEAGGFVVEVAIPKVGGGICLHIARREGEGTARPIPSDPTAA